MGYYTVIEPKYYQQFRCVGGSCELNCCGNWGNIVWTDSEYEKLCSTEMSEELRNKVNSSFFKKEFKGIQIWNIRQQDGECPFLTDKKLCELQLTFGEGILSQTCRIYPRTALMNNAVLMRNCYLSCPETGKLLYDNKDAMEISARMVQVRGATLGVSATVESEQNFNANPSLKYRNILFDFFYGLCSDENYSIETALVLGGLAAKNLSEYELSGKHDSIPDIIKTLKKQINTPERIASVDSINPDNRIKIGVIGTLMLDMAREVKSLNILESLCENGSIDVQKYLLGEQTVKKLFEGHEFYFRNMVLNMLFELKAPIYLPQRTIYENWLLICTCYSMSLMMMNAQALVEPDINLILKAAALLDMSYGHNEKLSDQIINFLKDRNFDKSAYIALMLK